ncbi:Hypothetical protein FKW44_003575 [Caligus rogercresseyi]|uniref:Uncharacterized protein n=1 Tax=Caligus rogercresseyi TaxID=217165 RepID=A0A7T8KLT7_CALRO|nr:Hypothetical protein FKW44_003575 [Caligus rogercresseyi]
MDGSSYTLSKPTFNNRGQYTREALNGTKPSITLPLISQNVFTSTCKYNKDLTDCKEVMGALVAACQSFCLPQVRSGHPTGSRL